MDYWHLVYLIPAVFSAAVIGANLMPVERTSRHNTAFLFISGLIVFNLPQEVQVCLAICLPVAYLHKFFGVSISGIEKMDYGFRKIPGILVKIKEKVVPEKAKEILTRAYPNPDEASQEEEVEPQTLTRVRKFVPGLP